MTENLNIKELLRVNFTWVFIVNLLIGIINLVTSLFFARGLGPLIMGDYATIIVGFELTFSFLSFGFNQYVISKKFEGDSYNVAMTATVFQSITLLFLFGIFFLLFSFIAPVKSIQIILPLFIIMSARILSLFNIMFYSKLEADFNYRQISFMRFIATLVGLTVAYVWYFMFADLYTLILRELSAAIVFIALTYQNVKPQIKLSFNRKSLKELYGFSSSLWSLNFLELAINRIDYAVIGFLAGKETLGVYYTLRNIMEGLLGFIINPVQTVLLAYYTRLKKSASYFKYLIRKTKYIYIPISVTLIIIILFIKVPAISILLGSNYQRGEAFLPGLSIYFCSLIWFENVKVFTISERIHYRMIIPRLMQLAIYSMIIFPLFNYFNLFGAGMATGIGAISLSITATFSGLMYYSTINK